MIIGAMQQMDIREFSEIVGVSTATVSRAFSGRGRISKKTQERILEQARKHGFAPNINAQRLSSKFSGVIGLYYTFGEEIIFDYYNMELAQEIAKACAERGISLHLVLRSPSQPDTQLNNLIAGKGLDGVIIVADSERSLDGLEKVIADCPTIVISNHVWAKNPSTGFIHLDFESGIEQAVKQLVKLGHRRIGFIRGLADETKFNAFKAALEQCGLKLNEALIANGPKTIEDGQRAIGELLKKKVDAVVCCTDLLAIGALQGAAKLGLSTPDQLSIVGMDDLALASQTSPSLASIGVPRSKIAASALQMLENVMNASEDKGVPSPQFMHTVNTFFVERDSITVAAQ